MERKPACYLSSSSNEAQIAFRMTFASHIFAFYLRVWIDDGSFDNESVLL